MRYGFPEYPEAIVSPEEQPSHIKRAENRRDAALLMAVCCAIPFIAAAVVAWFRGSY